MLLNIIDEKTSFRWFWPREREMLWWLDQDEEAVLHLSPDLYCQHFVCSSFDKLVGTSPSPTSPSNNLSKLTLLLLRLWDRDFFSPLIRIIFFNLERGAATFPAMFKDNERETRQWTLQTQLLRETRNVPETYLSTTAYCLPIIIKNKDLLLLLPASWGKSWTQCQTRALSL